MSGQPSIGTFVSLIGLRIAQAAIEDSAVNRLMTITGVNLAVAAGIMAAIGDISRFNSPQKLVSYFGLNPRVRQSGLGAAHHGRMSKIGRSHARARRPGPRQRRPVHCIFFADPRPARPSDRRGSCDSQAYRALLAFVDEGRGLPVGTPSAGR